MSYLIGWFIGREAYNKRIMPQSSSADLRSMMRRHIRQHCLLSGEDFSLSAGSRSSYYFDCKKATLDGFFLNWLTEYVLDDLLPQLPQPPNCVGGLTLGADFMTAALIMKAAERSFPLSQGSIVRKEKREHGTRAKIENELQQGERRILVVDDVITSGASIRKAYDAFIAAAYQPVALLAIVDREEGGAAALREELDVPLFSIFIASDFAAPQQEAQ